MSIRFLIAVILALSAASWAADTPPTTKPATQPALIDLKADLLAAQAALVASQANASQEFDNSPAAMPLLVDVRVKKAALEQARASGSPQDKLDASAAFNRSRKVLEDSEAEAIKVSKAVLAAQIKVASAGAAVSKAEADANAAAKADLFASVQDILALIPAKYQTDDPNAVTLSLWNDFISKGALGKQGQFTVKILELTSKKVEGLALNATISLGVDAQFDDKDRDEFVEAKQGQEITLKGQISGAHIWGTTILDIDLKHAHIVRAKKNPKRE